MWVYIQSEPGLWTVGHHAHNGDFEAIKDTGDENEAQRLVNYLNGGAGLPVGQAQHVQVFDSAIISQRGAILDVNMRDDFEAPSVNTGV